jgi:hypothetical protein
VCLGPGVSCRVLTVGYVGKLRVGPASLGFSTYADYVLTAASPELQNRGVVLHQGDALGIEHPGTDTIGYCVQRTHHPRIDFELRDHLLPALRQTLSGLKRVGRPRAGGGGALVWV